MRPLRPWALLLGALLGAAAAAARRYPHVAVLDGAAAYRLLWGRRGSALAFRLEVRTRGYVGFGLSAGGGMASADIVVGGVEGGRPYLQVRTRIPRPLSAGRPRSSFSPRGRPLPPPRFFYLRIAPSSRPFGVSHCCAPLPSFRSAPRQPSLQTSARVLSEVAGFLHPKAPQPSPVSSGAVSAGTASPDPDGTGAVALSGARRGGRSAGPAPSLRPADTGARSRCPPGLLNDLSAAFLSSSPDGFLPSLLKRAHG